MHALCSVWIAANPHRGRPAIDVIPPQLEVQQPTWCRCHTVSNLLTVALMCIAERLSPHLAWQLFNSSNLGLHKEYVGKDAASAHHPANKLAGRRPGKPAYAV